MFKALDLCAIEHSNLDVSKMEYCEDHRIWWTMYASISSWFNNWERDLVKLRFTFYNECGQCIIPDGQLILIINFDETCLPVVN